MTEAVIGFSVWCVVSCLFIGMGIYSIFAKKPRPMGFWANAEMFQVTDVKKYNKAVGKLFVAFGGGFGLLGLPLLTGENSAWITLTILGAMAEVIVVMVVYITVIERKYKKR